MTIVTAAQMKACDQYTIKQLGVPSLILMEHAALSVVEEIEKVEQLDSVKFLVACGSGNNGGDGFAIARLLHLKGYPVEILFSGNLEHLTPETKQQRAICQNYHIPILTNLPETNQDTILIDALLGIGLEKTLYPETARLIEQLNQLNLFVFSVDLPSGFSADTGEMFGAGIKANKTITFQFQKVGLTRQPAKKFAGDLIIKDIGISSNPLKKA